MGRTIIALAMFVVLSACAAGTSVDPGKVSQFQPGKTTYAEIVAALGSPDSSINLSNGTKTIAYSHIASSPFGAKIQSYAFSFDQRGVLILDTANSAKSTP